MISQRCLFVAVAAVGAAATLCGFARVHSQGSTVVVTPDRSTYTYKVGDKVGWTVSSTGPSGLPETTYTIKKNNAVVVQSGKLDLSGGKQRIEYVADEPEMLYMQFSSNPKKAYGAAVSPLELKPVATRPADFDSFWSKNIARLEAVPENPILTAAVSGREDVDYSTIQMDLVDGQHVYGQFAKPKKEGKYPALVQLQWASPPYPLQPDWILGRAAQGWLVLNIEPHETLATAPAAYYAALPDAIKKYASIGWEDRDKSYFLNMYLRDYRAVEYLSKRPDWNGKILVVQGTSMGGQQSLCVAGLNPKITHVIVEEPAGCDMNAGLHGRQEGYPFFPVNNAQVMATAPYFDPINFASRIKATSLVAMGYVDNIAPPAGIWTAFNLIKGRKEAAEMVEAPHNNLATHEQLHAYDSRSEDWLSTLAKGGSVDVRAFPTGKE